MSKKLNTELWAGTTSSYEAVQSAVVRMAATTEAFRSELKADSSTSGDRPTSPLLSMIGGVGIIQIAGALTNNNESARWNNFFGVTSYGNIREALALAVGDPLIKHILLDVNSGGGAVSGITDTSALIAQINKFVKPVTTYTGGVMASGAYWLGASASKVIASDVAVVGSIGVITSHMDYSASLAADGVKATVIRAGKFKQLNSPLEPLSDTGLAEIQANLDQVYSVFVQHVADSRSVSYSVADTQMAQGREFIGASALTAGLVDKVATFDSVIAELVSKVALDSNKSFSNNNLNPILKATNMTMSLNAQQLAVISAGGVLTPEEIAAATALATTEAAAAAAADVASTEEAAVVAAAEAALVATSATEEASAEGTTSVVTFLQTQLKDANAALLEATISLRTLEATSASAIANEKALLTIACGSVNKMSIALGGSERDLSAMSAVSVLAEHETVSGDFNKKFKVGGVAVSTLDENANTPAKASVTPIQQARINAAKKKEGK